MAKQHAPGFLKIVTDAKTRVQRMHGGRRAANGSKG